MWAFVSHSSPHMRTATTTVLSHSLKRSHSPSSFSSLSLAKNLFSPSLSLFSRSVFSQVKRQSFKSSLLLSPSSSSRFATSLSLSLLSSPLLLSAVRIFRQKCVVNAEEETLPLSLSPLPLSQTASNSLTCEEKERSPILWILEVGFLLVFHFFSFPFLFFKSLFFTTPTPFSCFGKTPFGGERRVYLPY